MTVGILVMQQWCVVDLPSPELVCGWYVVYPNLSWKTMMVNFLHVLCFLTGAIAGANAHFNPGEGPIFLDDVQCSGIEASLLSCVSSPVYSHNCHHSEVAGASCQS